MICPNCHANVPDYAAFCPICGIALAKTQNHAPSVKAYVQSHPLEADSQPADKPTPPVQPVQSVRMQTAATVSPVQAVQKAPEVSMQPVSVQQATITRPTAEPRPAVQQPAAAKPAPMNQFPVQNIGANPYANINAQTPVRTSEETEDQAQVSREKALNHFRISGVIGIVVFLIYSLITAFWWILIKGRYGFNFAICGTLYFLATVICQIVGYLHLIKAKSDKAEKKAR